MIDVNRLDVLIDELILTLKRKSVNLPTNIAALISVLADELEDGLAKDKNPTAELLALKLCLDAFISEMLKTKKN